MLKLEREKSAPLAFQHRIHHREKRTLLRGRQAQPFFQHAALPGRQGKQCLAVGKKLRERQPKCVADLFSEENEGVMPFWYQDEMVDCGRPERSAS